MTASELMEWSLFFQIEAAEREAAELEAQARKGRG